MTSTFEHIQTITLASAQNKIQFTNLPQTYTDLVIYGTLNSASPSSQVDHVISRFGNNAYDSSGYNMISMFARSTPDYIESYGAFSQAQIRPYHFTYIPRGSNQFGLFVMSLFNYTNTNVAKTFQITAGGVGADAYAGIDIQNGFSTSTSAINQIEFGMWTYAYDLDAGSEISVYGIKKE